MMFNYSKFLAGMCVAVVVGAIVVGATDQARAEEPTLIIKNPESYDTTNTIKWKSGGHITTVYNRFDPATMSYRPGFHRTFDVDGTITSYFYHHLAKKTDMSVTSLPYLLALQDVYNGATELDLTVLGEAKNGATIIGGRLMSPEYLGLDKIDMTLAQASSSESLEHLIRNITTTASPTRKIFGTVLLGLRFSRTGQQGPEIVKALTEIYKFASPKRPWLNLSPRLFSEIEPSLAEVRAAVIFTMHFLNFVEPSDGTSLSEILRLAKNDKDEVVRVLAQETERILLKGKEAPANAKDMTDSIIQKCLIGLRSK